MPDSGVGQHTDRSGTNLVGCRAGRKLSRQVVSWHWKEIFQGRQGAWVGRPVVKNAEHSGKWQTTPAGFGEKPIDGGAAVMRNDLRQVEFRVHAILHEVIDLTDRIRMRICPSAKYEIWYTLPDVLAQLPRMFNATGRPDALVAPEHDERLEAVIACPIGIRKAVIDPVFARQERDDTGSRHVGAEIDDQMPQVVFFFRPDGAVGEKHDGPAARQAADGVIRINPRVTARRCFQFSARWTKLCGNDAGSGA